MANFVIRAAVLLVLICTPPVGTVILFFFTNHLWVKYGEFVAAQKDLAALGEVMDEIEELIAQAEAAEDGEWEFGGLDVTAQADA